MTEQIKDDWQAGFDTGYNLGSPEPPSGVDKEYWSNGYAEGKAAGEERTDIVISCTIEEFMDDMDWEAIAREQEASMPNTSIWIFRDGSFEATHQGTFPADETLCFFHSNDKLTIPELKGRFQTYAGEYFNDEE